jgi:hypothetical protein
MSQRSIYSEFLDSAPNEAAGVLAAIEAGKVDGSTYGDGDCACLIGTVANLRHCKLADLPPAIAPNSSRPAEQFFMAIRPGHLPAFSMQARLAVEWIREWLTINVDRTVVVPTV